MTIRIEAIEEPTERDREAIFAPLLRHNDDAGPPTTRVPVALLLRDERGEAVGGLWGRIVYDWLFVELLAVPQTLRGQGQGRALIERAEAIARAHGCAGLWLDTFAFQARPFYEKLGFSVFGTIENHPIGSARYFLQKRL